MSSIAASWNGDLELAVALPVGVGALDDDLALLEQALEDEVDVELLALRVAHAERDVLEVAEERDLALLFLYLALRRDRDRHRHQELTRQILVVVVLVLLFPVARRLLRAAGAGLAVAGARGGGGTAAAAAAAPTAAAAAAAGALGGFAGFGGIARIGRIGGFPGLRTLGVVAGVGGVGDVDARLRPAIALGDATRREEARDLPGGGSGGRALPLPFFGALLGPGRARGAPTDQVGDRRHLFLAGLRAPLFVAARRDAFGLVRLFSRRTQPPGAHNDTPDDERFDFTTTP